LPIGHRASANRRGLSGGAGRGCAGETLEPSAKVGFGGHHQSFLVDRDELPQRVEYGSLSVSRKRSAIGASLVIQARTSKWLKMVP